VLASNVVQCIHCGAATPVKKIEFAFREGLLAFYQYLIPKGQYENVMGQLRDDYEARFRDFGYSDRARRKANLWLMAEMARDLGPAVIKLFASLGGGLGFLAAIRWILRRDE
jgi:hypothetical protein